MALRRLNIIAEFRARTKGFEGQVQGAARQMAFFEKATRSAKVQLTNLVARSAIEAVLGLGDAIGEAVSKYAELTDAQAGVSKTTDLTVEEVARLRRELEQIDTRSTVEELLAIAQAGGRLAVAQDEIFDFTRAVDRAFVALGDELRGDAGQIATEIGKIAGLFEDSLRDIDPNSTISENILRIGSAINELGATSKAQSQFILDATRRLSGFTSLANFDPGFVLGLSATLDVLGLRAEASTTAILRFLSALANPKDIARFADVAGLTVKEFEELSSVNPGQAFTKVLEGVRLTRQEVVSLNNASGEGDFEGFLEELGAPSQGLRLVGEIIRRLGLTSVRSAQAITALTQNTDELAKNVETGRKQISLTADELDTTSSIAIEFSKVNETLAADFNKLSNAGREFSNLVVEGMAPAIKGATQFFTALIKQAISLFEAIRSAPETITILITVLGVLTSRLIANSAAWVANTVRIIANTSATEAYLAISILTQAALGRLKSGFAALFSVLRNNPLGLVIAATGALITAVQFLSRATQDAINVERVRQTVLNELAGVFDRVADAQEKVNQAVKDFSTASGSEREDIQEGISLQEKRIDFNIKEAFALRERLKAELELARQRQQSQGTAPLQTGPGGVAIQNLVDTEQAATRAEIKLREVDELIASLIKTQSEVRQEANALKDLVASQEEVLNRDLNVSRRSIEALRALLKEFTTIRDQADPDSDKFVQASRRVAEIQARIDFLLGKTKKSTKDLAKEQEDAARRARDYAQEQRDAARAIEDLQIALIDSDLARQLREIQVEFDRAVEDQVGSAEQREQQETLRNLLREKRREEAIRSAEQRKNDIRKQLIENGESLRQELEDRLANEAILADEKRASKAEASIIRQITEQRVRIRRETEKGRKANEDVIEEASRNIRRLEVELLRQTLESLKLQFSDVEIAGLEDQIEQLLGSIEVDDQERVREKLEEIKEIIDLIGDSATKVTQFIRDLADAQVDRIDAQIKQQEKAVEAARDASASILKIEQDRLDKLNQQREEAVRRQRNAAALEITVNSALAVSRGVLQVIEGFDKGVVAGIASAVALAAVVGSSILAIRNAVSGIGSFAQGTELIRGTEGIPGPSRGTIVEVHKGERIVPAAINKKLGSIPNDQLPGLMGGQLAGLSSPSSLTIRQQGSSPALDTNKVVAAVDGVSKRLDALEIQFGVSDRGLFATMSKYKKRINRTKKIK